MADSSESKPTLFGELTMSSKFWKVRSSLPLLPVMVEPTRVRSLLFDLFISRLSTASFFVIFARFTI